jgi:microcin C transport system substrate-binding protein
VAVTRREALIIGAGALATASGLATRAPAADEVETHGISSFGDLKYPADFKHFEYVDVNRSVPRAFTIRISSRSIP